VEIIVTLQLMSQMNHRDLFCTIVKTHDIDGNGYAIPIDLRSDVDAISAVLKDVVEAGGLPWSNVEG